MSNVKINITKKNTGLLQDFIKKYRVNKGENYTHTLMGPPWGIYNIPEKDIDEFFNVYHKAVFINGEPSYLVEKHEEIGPILIDLDFRYENTSERLYNHDTIREFLNKYSELLHEYLELQEKHCRAFVFEKSQPVKDQKKKNVTKDGIHIVFPYINTLPSLQYIIRNQFLEKYKDLFKGLNLINPIDDIFDESVIYRNAWQVYGSCKPECESYKLTQIYKTFNSNITELSYSERKNDYNDTKYLIQLFSIRRRKILTTVIKEKQKEIENYGTNDKTVNVKKKNTKTFW